jgi:hypothetical protein
MAKKEKAKFRISIGCLCEEGNYPCDHCQALLREEIAEIDREFAEEKVVEKKLTNK